MTFQSMKFLLIENGSYSNPDCCFFSRCSRRFLNGSEGDGSGDPLSAFACCGGCSGTVGELCDAFALAVRRRLGIGRTTSLFRRGWQPPRPP
jgi:hypothetical protein